MQDTIVEQQNLPLINVAVAVIQREDGHVLMAERPYGKESAGFWEFPGGKFELGEGAEQAIARELYEELGIKFKKLTHGYATSIFIRTKLLSYMSTVFSPGKGHHLVGKVSTYPGRIQVQLLLCPYYQRMTKFYKQLHCP